MIWQLESSTASVKSADSESDKTSQSSFFREIARRVLASIPIVIASGFVSYLVSYQTSQSYFNDRINMGYLLSDHVGYRYFHAVLDAIPFDYPIAEEGRRATLRTKEVNAVYRKRIEEIHDEASMFLHNPLLIDKPQSLMKMAMARNMFVAEYAGETKSPSLELTSMMCGFFFEDSGPWGTEREMNGAPDDFGDVGRTQRKKIKQYCEQFRYVLADGGEWRAAASQVPTITKVLKAQRVGEVARNKKSIPQIERNARSIEKLRKDERGPNP